MGQSESTLLRTARRRSRETADRALELARARAERHVKEVEAELRPNWVAESPHEAAEHEAFCELRRQIDLAADDGHMGCACEGVAERYLSYLRRQGFLLENGCLDWRSPLGPEAAKVKKRGEARRREMRRGQDIMRATDLANVRRELAALWVPGRNKDMDRFRQVLARIEAGEWRREIRVDELGSSYVHYLQAEGFEVCRVKDQVVIRW